MNRILFVPILCLIGCLHGICQTDSRIIEKSSAISPEAEEIIDNAIGSENDTSAVIFLREARMTVGDGGLYSISYHIIGQIFDEKAKDDYSQIPVHFNSFYEEVNLDFARTIEKDKTFTEVSKDAVQIKTTPEYYGVKSYTDSKILTFSLPALKPGKFFEYQITVKMKVPIVNNYWFESFNFNLVLYSLIDPYYVRIDPVKVSRFVLSVSEDESFQSSVINAQIHENKKVEDGVAIHTWEVEDLPTIKLESGMPYLYEVTPLITVSSIPDWEIYGNWVHDMLSSAITVSDEIKKIASELTMKVESKNEKIKLLYDFVKKEIDYIQADLDRGGLKPHSADEVFRTKYGDCKDQVVLLLSLLKAVNIEAYPALINTYSYRNHQQFLPTQYFDHLIVFVSTDTVDFWLDTTTDLNEFPTLYSGDQNRWALIVDGKESRFLKTPAAVMDDNTAILNLTMSAQNDSLTGILETLCTGVFKESFTGFMEYYSKSEYDQYFKDVVESYFYQVANVKEINSFKGLTAEESFRQNISFNYIQPTSEYTFFKYSSSITLAFNLFYIVLPLDEVRQFDYIFPFKFVLKGRELLKAPWNYALIKNCPESDSVINKYFTFKQIFEEFKDSVIVNWEYALKENFLPKEDYKLFNDDVLKIEEMIKWQIDFQKTLDSKSFFSTLASYFGVNQDSTMNNKEFNPPRYLNSLSIAPSIQKQITSVIVEYIDAINEGDAIRALAVLHKENAERRSINRGVPRKLKSVGITLKVENITTIDLVYDYAIVTYTIIMEMEKKSTTNPIRFDYVSILYKSDHEWKIFSSHVKNYIDNCALYSSIARLYYNNNDYHKALVIYDLTMANDSTCTSAFGSTGWIYYLKGDFNNCIKYSSRAVKLDKSALYAHYNIALSYLCLGELEKAKSKYNETIKLNKDLNQEIHPGAIEDLQDLIKNNFKKTEAEMILNDLFEVKDINKSVPLKAQ